MGEVRRIIEAIMGCQRKEEKKPRRKYHQPKPKKTKTENSSNVQNATRHGIHADFSNVQDARRYK